MIKHIQGYATGFAEDFRGFIMRGNVVDLAVGVIIGAAFGTIVTSLVQDILMPLLGAIIGQVDFSQNYLVLSDVPAGIENNLASLRKAGVAVLAWGNFLSVVINFLLMALGVFVVIRQVARLQRMAEAALVQKAADDQQPDTNATNSGASEPAPDAQAVALLTEIRDALKTKDAR